MPELPEVQTVVSQLDARVSGQKVSGFWSGWEKKVLTPIELFREKVLGATFLCARRLGKHIVIDLDNGYSLICHLKMTGHFLYKTAENKENPAFADRVNGYIHHIFTFTDGSTLEFSDMRKFGWLRVEKTNRVESLKSIQALGIDAVSPTLTPKAFQNILASRPARTIGEVLLDQGLIAGVGNIYRSEALYLAGVLPMRRISTLTGEEIKKILPSIKKVLNQASRLQGTSDGDFRDLDGLAGRFQRTLFVYRRQGAPCKKCGTIIVRNKLGSRSIFFCTSCQK
jgi:formamidopyrimidine-DNA glycosylase